MERHHQSGKREKCQPIHAELHNVDNLEYKP